MLLKMLLTFCTFFVLLKVQKPGNKSTWFPGLFEYQKYKSTKSTNNIPDNTDPNELEK